MARIPIIENVSEDAPLLKVRHAGRADPWGIKSRKGLRQSYMLHGRRPLRRHPKKPARTR